MKAEEKAKRDIYAWLDSRNYQTEYEETGEYKMYFACDMPKILEAYHQYASQTEMPSEEFEIDFDRHVKAKISIKNNVPKVIAAMNGYGDPIRIENISLFKLKGGE